MVLTFFSLSSVPFPPTHEHIRVNSINCDSGLAALETNHGDLLSLRWSLSLKEKKREKKDRGKGRVCANETNARAPQQSPYMLEFLLSYV